MVVIRVTMKTEGTKTIYCSIRGLERLNALDPDRYQQVKTKLGLAVAPYPGQVMTFVEKTAQEVLRVLTEDLWMTVQSHDQPVRGEESWTLQSNNRYPGAASQEYEQQKTEYQAREKKIDDYNYMKKLKNDAKKPLTLTELCKVSGLKDYPLVVTEQKRVDWIEYEAFESYYLPLLTTINSCKVDADLFMLKTLCKAKWNEQVKQ